jgi:putative acetyltransferase
MALVTGIAIAAPRDEADLDAIRALVIEYSTTLGFSLSYQGFEAELAEFPGVYAPPFGALLLARANGDPAGAVALRKLGPGICEMKRLYVRPAFRALRTEQGLSIGRALALAIAAEARRIGYERMRLDTIASEMGAAMKIYRAMGFIEVPAYYESPIPGTAFLELLL